MTKKLLKLAKFSTVFDIHITSYNLIFTILIPRLSKKAGVDLPQIISSTKTKLSGILCVKETSVVI